MRPLHERATKWEKIDLRRLENARVIFFLFLIGIEGKKYSEEQAKVTENFFQEEGKNYNKYYISFEERNSLICETNEVQWSKKKTRTKKNRKTHPYSNNLQ